MSKENVFTLFAKASTDKQLKHQLEAASSFTELVELGKAQGLAFSSDQVKEAIAEVAVKKPGFLAELAQAVLEVFSPSHDDYPAIGVQPFSGDPHSTSKD